MEIVQNSIKNGVLSEKIISHCATRGTKRVKRTTVNCLSQNLYNANRHDKESLASSIEEFMLLFAATDDSDVIDTLTENLSVDNLPWVMPSASKFPWLLRRINQRIEWSRD